MATRDDGASEQAQGAKAGRIIAGPILHFRGVGRGDGPERWRLSALVVVEGAGAPPHLVLGGGGPPVPPRHVFVWRDRHIWRYAFEIVRSDQERRVSYGFAGAAPAWAVVVPGYGGRFRVAYAASNGHHDTYEVSRLPGGTDGRWGEVLRQHRDRPYHLLIQGGDQIHADNLWRDCSALGDWWATPVRRRHDLPFTRQMADQAMDYYFRAYVDTFSQPAYAAAMAAIPSVMMWDDHDIFDGWGSRPAGEHECQVYRGLFAVARRQFSLFQLGAALRDPLESLWGSGHGTFSQGFRVGDVGVLALDLRSERTRTEVLGAATWRELPGWLARFHGCKQLLVASAVPLAFVGLDWLAGAVRRLPGTDHLQDDLHDQWRSAGHDQEWLKLLRTLADFGLRHRCRVTVLSGEVHLGAAARIRAGGVDMWQLISSGVVHQPLGAAATAALSCLVRSPERVADDVALEFPVFGETGKRFIRARNFLSLDFDRHNRLNVRWLSEGDPAHYALTI